MQERMRDCGEEDKIPGLLWEISNSQRPFCLSKLVKKVIIMVLSAIIESLRGNLEAVKKKAWT